MSTAGITLNTWEFDQAVRKILPREAGITVGEVLRDQMRLLVETLFKWTPPSTKSKGYKTIQHDLDKLCTGYRNAGALDALLDDMNSRGADHTFRYKDGKRYRIDRDHVIIDAGALPGIHQSHRNSRGRVRRVARKYMVRNASLKSYIKDVQTRVGKVKAGWMPALALFHGQSLPAWISTHSGFGHAHGSARDNLGADMRGTLEVSNDVPYIRDDGMLNRAMDVRRADIQKHLEKRLVRLCEKVSAK